MTILKNFPPTDFLIMFIISKTLIALQGIGILKKKSGCNLDSSTPYYHLQNHLNKMDNSISVRKSTTLLAIISLFLYNIFIQEPHLLKKVLLLQQKEDMPLSIFENHIFILTKYANIQKIIPSIFISSAHKLTLALIIITLLMIKILGIILLKIQKISKKNKYNANTYRICTKNSFEVSDKTFTDRLDIQLLTFSFFYFLYILFYIDYRLKGTLEIFSDTDTFHPSLS